MWNPGERRLLGRLFCATHARLRKIADRPGVDQAVNLMGCRVRRRYLESSTESKRRLMIT